MDQEKELVQNLLNCHISKLMDVAKGLLTREVDQREERLDMIALSLAYYFVYCFLKDILKKEGYQITQSIIEEVQKCASNKVETYQAKLSQSVN